VGRTLLSVAFDLCGRETKTNIKSVGQSLP